MKKIFLYIGILSASLFAGCSSDNYYEPDNEIVENCMGVYFVQESASATIQIGTEDERSLTVEARRKVTTEAASVPVTVISSDAIFNIPATVDFAAGEETAELTILFPDMEVGKKYRFEIAVTDRALADPYLKYENGSTHFAAVVNIESWELMARASFYFDDYRFDMFEADIYQATGTNKYKIENFLNSGKSLVYTLENGNVVPQEGLLEDYFWYLSDDDGYTACYPPNSYDISFQCFSMYLDGYSYMDTTDNYGCFYGSVLTNEDTDWEWIPLYFYW